MLTLKKYCHEYIICKNVGKEIMMRIIHLF